VIKMTTQGEIEDATLDFNREIAIDAIPEGRLLKGVFEGEPLVALRRGDRIGVFRGKCTHLGGPLAEGLLVGDTVRCPWHQACFDLATGEAVAAPAFAPLARFSVHIEGGRVRLAKPQAADARRKPRAPAREESILIVGGGGAGFAAADMLCREGVERGITLVSSDSSKPYERTLLTKDYLDGGTDDPRIGLGAEPLDERGVRIELNAEVARLDRGRHIAALTDGRELRYDRLLLATGAEPRRPDFPGAGHPQVHVLRSLADARAIVAAAKSARRVVVLGSSFIGLEAGASLRQRGLEVDIVSQDKAPMARIFGPEIASVIIALHEKHGVRLHLGRAIASFDGAAATLDDGARLEADLLLIGIGVTPRLQLAKAAGLQVEDGVVVDRFLQTSDGDVFAAGDIAAWPDPHSGQRLRVEHWDVAVRQGQIAAKNMLGGRTPYADVPFFWSMQFDFLPSYLGHAKEWDEIRIDGDPAKNDCAARYLLNGRVMAALMIGRDMECLEERERMERALAG